jgi:ribokinase
MRPSIVVVGSSNTDMVIKTAKLPAPGETVLGGTFFMSGGGKGANQAVAAQRLGGAVTFVAKIGADIFGQQALQSFQQEGMDTTCVFTDSRHASGVALIMVGEGAENCIAVASGANAALHLGDVKNAEAKIAAADAVLMQLEIPVETVTYVASFAAQHNRRVILNPAPAAVLPDALFKNISIITPNEGETEVLTGIKITDEESLVKAAAVLHGKGVATVIITLGPRGAFISSSDSVTEHVPAPVIEAVDTTAAGDVFNGALAVALSEGMALKEAVVFGCNAAALSVTRLGAQASAPYRNEVV